MRKDKFMFTLIIIGLLLATWCFGAGYLLIDIACDSESVIAKLSQLEEFSKNKDEPFEPGTMLKYIESEKSLIESHIEMFDATGKQFLVLGVSIVLYMLLVLVYVHRFKKGKMSNA
jgi:hypothetical protein